MLHVNDLTFRIGSRLILDRASFNLPTGSRVPAQIPGRLVTGREGRGRR